ncbi:MAG: sugar-binding domain-containing protein, partial [Planctomycetota bacterium JB042]
MLAPLLLPLAFLLPTSERPTHVLPGPWTIATDADEAPRPVAVPDAFETALGTDFDGAATYSTSFTVPPAFEAKRTWLEFEAVATEATVTLNDVELGRHLGGWTTFRFDVTDHLRAEGTNDLSVRVDEKVGHDTQGFLPIVQPHFGGIWRPVRLLGLPAVHLDDLNLLAVGDPDTSVVLIEAPVTGDDAGCAVDFEVTIGDETFRAPIPPGRTRLPVRGFERWDVDRPHRYPARFTLRRGGTTVDRIDVSVAFRSVRTEGRTLLLNGRPLNVRGVLDWGYRPPSLRPDPDDAQVRREIAAARARGFNLVKFCLWVPPRHVLQQFDEAGMLTWMEYPTWHPRFDAERHPQLAREFGRFFAHDRNHPSVILRSLTCETGPSASLEVVKDLYDRCKAAIPGAIVEDDSSWIAWNRVHDFYDDHPYGNNDTWPATLDRLNAHIDAREAKPLLLGEAIAADTWPALDRFDGSTWWAPIHLDAQREWIETVGARFGREVPDRLGEWSRRFALAQRKDQIETFRAVVPDGGYVVSVARDFTLAEMGLQDARGRWKWGPKDWSWHGDTMPVLGRGTPRSFAGGTTADLPIVVAHHGEADLPAGSVHWRFGEASGAIPHDAIPRGGVVEVGAIPLPAPDVAAPTAVPLELTLDDRVIQNRFDTWVVPAPPLRPSAVARLDRLDEAALDRIVAGGAAIVAAHGAPGSFLAPATWLLRGSLWFPGHPLEERFPPEFFLDLAAKDVHPTGLLPLDALFEHVTPIVGFWETHDIREVRDRALAWETRVGAGRLLVTSLRLDESPAGRALAA